MEQLWPLLAGVVLGSVLTPIVAATIGQVRDWWHALEDPPSAVPIAMSIAGSVLVLMVLLAAGWIAYDSVIRVVADPHWLSTVATLGPEATAMAAIVALAVGWFTILQRYQTDRRDQWRKRAEWALELALSPAGEGEDGSHVTLRRTFAVEVLNELAGSPLASPDDARLVGRVSDQDWLTQLGASLGEDAESEASGIKHEPGNENPTMPEPREG